MATHDPKNNRFCLTFKSSDSSGWWWTVFNPGGWVFALGGLLVYRISDLGIKGFFWALGFLAFGIGIFVMCARQRAMGGRVVIGDGWVRVFNHKGIRGRPSFESPYADFRHILVDWEGGDEDNWFHKPSVFLIHKNSSPRKIALFDAEEQAEERLTPKDSETVQAIASEMKVFVKNPPEDAERKRADAEAPLSIIRGRDRSGQDSER